MAPARDRSFEHPHGSAVVLALKGPGSAVWRPKEEGRCWRKEKGADGYCGGRDKDDVPRTDNAASWRDNE